MTPKSRRSRSGPAIGTGVPMAADPSTGEANGKNECPSQPFGRLAFGRLGHRSENVGATTLASALGSRPIQ